MLGSPTDVSSATSSRGASKGTRPPRLHHLPASGQRKGLERYTRQDWVSWGAGRVSDKAIAAAIGISPTTVAYWRDKHGFPKPPGWRKADPAVVVPLLGTKSDADVAASVGLSQSRITQVRRSLRIPPFRTIAVHYPELIVSTTAQVYAASTGHKVGASRKWARKHGLQFLPAREHPTLFQEGDRYARSMPEAKMDAFIHSEGWRHRHEVPIGRYRADFVIDTGTPATLPLDAPLPPHPSSDDWWIIEVCGFRSPHYEARQFAKKAAYERDGWHHDFFSARDVESVFSVATLPLVGTVPRASEPRALT